ESSASQQRSFPRREARLLSFLVVGVRGGVRRAGRAVALLVAGGVLGAASRLERALVSLGGRVEGGHMLALVQDDVPRSVDESVRVVLRSERSEVVLAGGLALLGLRVV